MNSKPSVSYVNQQIKKMRLNGVAFDLDKYLDSFKLNKNAVASLKWLNNPVWWSRIENKSCILTPPMFRLLDLYGQIRILFILFTA